jgi:Kef-type K+ transport system membrane component KefB
LGLAAIIGAFLSGLILSDLNIVEEHENEENIDDLIAPIELLFAPIFFVMMGMQVDILAFLNPLTLGLGVVLAVAGIIGKLVCALFTGKEPNYLSVGIGMVPRGEVGLIFAGVGKTLGVVSQPIFASLVFMVFITTVITPPLLKLSLRPRL